MAADSRWRRLGVEAVNRGHVSGSVPRLRLPVLARIRFLDGVVFFSVQGHVFGGVFSDYHQSFAVEVASRFGC